MQTIGIVNNERNLVQSMALVLRAAGYEVRVYHRSDLALHALLQQPVELALLDITNPPLGGIKLFRRLREHTAMPVMFLSAWAEEAAEELGRSGLAAQGYIQIPVSLAELRARVRAVLAPASAESPRLV
jgi:two-component system, OmpR family, response regulator ChvI